MQKTPLLVVLAGLPGTGKSSIARGLAHELDAAWLRIDTIEQAIRDAGIDTPLDDSGYRVAYALAEDNLRLGRNVVGDSVNPWMLTRNAWRDAGLRAAARIAEIETVCSDLQEHRARVEARTSEIAGLTLPTWQETIGRDYHPWDRDHIVIDTAGRSVETCVGLCVTALRSSK